MKRALKTFCRAGGAAAAVLLAALIYFSFIVADAGKSHKEWESDFIFATKLRLAQIKQDIDRFKHEHGRLPNSLEEIYGRSINDFFGNEISYRVDAGTRYELASPGPDHRLGTNDDEHPPSVAVTLPSRGLDSRALFEEVRHGRYDSLYEQIMGSEPQR